MSDSKSLSELNHARFDVPILLLVCAIALGFSLFLPLFRVEQMVIWKSNYSIMTGVVGLFKDKQYFLAAILFFFSIVFPIAKLILIAWLWTVKLSAATRETIFYWLGILGKWSMLDVFVVAILIVVVKIGPLAAVTPLNGIYVFASTIIGMILVTTWVEKLNKPSTRI